MSNLAVFWTVVSFGLVICFLVTLPTLIRISREVFKKTRYNALGESSKIRLVRQLNDAVIEMSAQKTGAIITIVNKDSLDTFRTDGVKIDANISAPLILSIFNKYSPLHDGAVVIESNKITYAATYYKITSKSIDNKYGARHRAAMGISEQTDALTIVVSEQTGAITFALNAEFIKVKPMEFQEKLTEYLT